MEKIKKDYSKRLKKIFQKNKDREKRLMYVDKKGREQNQKDKKEWDDLFDGRE